MSVLNELYAMDRPHAIARLQGDYTLFCKAVEEMLERNPLPPIVPADDSQGQALACLAAQELRDKGIVFLRGFIRDQEALEEARQFARVVKARSDLFDVGENNYMDEEMGGLLWERSASRFNSRVSFNAKRMPPVLQGICLNAIYNDIINKASGYTNQVEPFLVVVDHLQRCEEYEYQWWHVDRIREQYKVLIMLSDVTDDNGPMKIIPGTQHFEGKRRIFDFASFAEGLDYGGSIGYNVYSKRTADTLYAKGKAGDVVLFNTRAYHCHGRPNSGERMTTTVYYGTLPTPLNRFLDDFNPPGETV